MWIIFIYSLGLGLGKQTNVLESTRDLNLTGDALTSALCKHKITQANTHAVHGLYRVWTL